MFKIREDSSGGLKRLKIQNTATGEFVSIVPGFGANINELVLHKNGTLHPVIAGNRDISGFRGKGVFKGAKLIPFPNRLEDGTYTFEGERYQLELNYPEELNACHGFIYDKEFIIEGSAEKTDHASVKLVYHYNGFLPGYPFNCKIELDYTLGGSRGFRCRTCIENLGERSMPVGDGWHPFFGFQRKVDELLLRFPAEQKIIVDERSIPSGESLPYDLFDSLNRIGDIELDTCFRLKPGKDGIRISELYDRQKDVKLQLWQETGENKYNYLQIYIPPDRGSIAMEPMTCNINAFNNREGLIILRPEQKFEAGYGVKLA
ncbi:MAG: hypothetical protein U9R44_03390 [Candidatus Omnitrophota bacterium]|nr:hypothetical protein [Candidatus Omnitrophota bacterium]